MMKSYSGVMSMTVVSSLITIILTLNRVSDAVRRMDADLFEDVQRSSPQQPSIRDLLNSPVEVVEGSDALMTCIVRNIGTNTVFWSKVEDGDRSILTVDKVIITKDRRFLVLHDGSAPDASFIRDGGDVWVLAIRNVTTADSGAYSCRVNSNPPVQTVFSLDVKTNASVEADIELRSSHNYTRCCQLAGVSTKCLGYCSIHTLLEGNVGVKEEECEEHLGEVVRCMADQRNHEPCCKKAGVPDICQELCRGQYTPQDDYVKSHFSCANYLESTLMCISEGIDLLPLPPVSPIVKVNGPTSVNVSWSHPQLAPSVPEHYVITVTPIKQFDPPQDYTESRHRLPSTTEHPLSNITVQRYVTKVPVNITHFVQNLLKPLTWYEIEVTSENRHGASLPPYTLRALTRPSFEVPSFQVTAVQLPDVVGCCISKGVKQERCLSNLCNPRNSMIAEPDMIVCAPWATEVFSCLAGNYDHSQCCRERNLPDVCVELCTGEVDKIDYRHFRCVDYFSDYRSCLFRGYGVLPSSPESVSVSNIFTTHALLSWTPPVNNTDSIKSYHSYYRPVNASRECLNKWSNEVGSSSYKGVYSPRSPFILEGLCEDTEYEVYIQAFNSHGASDPSNRVLFTTQSEQDLEIEEHKYVYNVTACCETVSVSPGCMPLCSYNARMSHFSTLSKNCAAEINRILRCGVGGRNHADCCARRGVPEGCLPVCSGTYVPDDVTENKCHLYVGNIVLCLEDGVGLIPGPVRYLHITAVTSDGVTLAWEPPAEGAVPQHYQVHYESVNKNSNSPVRYTLDNVLNATRTVAVVKGLQNDLIYNFFVVGVNDNGASLPSSVIQLNVSEYLNQIKEGKRSPSAPISAVPSAPHNLRLEGKTTTSLTILWETPELALPTDRFKYQIHFAEYSSSNYTVVVRNNSIVGGSATSSQLMSDPRVISTTQSTAAASTVSESSSNSNLYNGLDFDVKDTVVTALKLENLKPNTRYVIWITATNDMGQSQPSETLLAWTDPAYPAFVETPTVHPTSLVIEGSTVTILCIAMGSPPPTVSLYISGILVHQDVARHMKTVVQNISRNMSEISCYADNGYGAPMQRSITITISRPPIINGPTMVHTTLGRPTALRCTVDAWPKPSMVWWRDPDGRVAVIHGGNYAIQDDGETGTGEQLMEVKIKSVNESDTGDFYCFARNAFGSTLHHIKLIASPPIRRPAEVTACCRASNITDECMSACDFDAISIDRILNNENCVPQFDILIRCAADDSDHRSCCNQRGVPESCLNWCRQEPVRDNRHCLLVWAPAIFACFDEGRELLPGPPLDVRITSGTNGTAVVQWSVPKKNPEKVELYRVFWRVLGQRTSERRDTSDTQLSIDGLRAGVTYEVAVKAGNEKGTSVLTPTLTYMYGEPYVSSASLQSSDSIGVAVGVVVAVLLLLVGVVAAVWYRWRGKIINSCTQGSISFQNPSYITGHNGDTVQIAETPNGSLNGTLASELNRSSSTLTSTSDITAAGTIGLNGGDCYNNGVGGSIWSTQQEAGPDTPGFQDDLKNNRKYSRFSGSS